jgi:hypothetical protein
MMLQKYSPISDAEPNMREDSAAGTYYWCDDVDALLQSNAATSNEIVAQLNARVAELHRIVATLWNDVDPADYEDIREAVMIELAQRTGP